MSLAPNTWYATWKMVSDLVGVEWYLMVIWIHISLIILSLLVTGWNPVPLPGYVTWGDLTSVCLSSITVKISSRETSSRDVQILTGRVWSSKKPLVLTHKSQDFHQYLSTSLCCSSFCVLDTALVGAGARGDYGQQMPIHLLPTTRNLLRPPASFSSLIIVWLPEMHT